LYEKILSAVDGSFHSELASRYAVALASFSGSELIVLAVDNGEVEREVLSNAVEHACLYANKMGIHARSIIREGATVKTILNAINAEHIDLLIVATRRGEHRLFVRSITQQLMVQSPCSVIAVKPSGVPRKGKKMLLPISHRDLSSDERITLAASLARFFQYSVEIFHVVERQQWYNLPREKLHRMRQHAEQNILPVAKMLKELDIETDVRAVIAQSSVNAILKEAAIEKHSMVLLGASRRGVWKQVVSGNIIEEMLSRLLCDVLIWRPKP
jgi:nucleotide-binding universal stress UspA family protein